MLDIQDALSLLEKREAAEAARLLEHIVAEMPAYPMARVLLARSYEAMNDWNRASAVWREAWQLIPNSPVVLQGLARSAAGSGGRRPRARSEAEAAPQERPAGTEKWMVGAQERPAGTPERPAGTQERPAGTPERPAATLDQPEDTGVSWRRTEEPEPPRPLRAQDVSLPTHMPPEPSEAADEFEELHDVEDTGTPHYEDLDRLINEIESARIVPRPDLESLPSPDLEDDIEDVVSETLARIYASQGQYDEAARIYELLAGQHPEEADDFLQKASQMRSRASDG